MSYPQFIDDTTYISMDASATDTEQLQAMLSNLTRIHLLTASKFESFDELIHEYLVSGIEVFGLETGIVSEIKDETYIVRDVISPLEVLEKGQEFALEDTYCREVIKSRQVLGFPKVGELEYMNCHPVYQNLKLEAYLSSPIFVGDELFGTLNFTSVAAREHGFSVYERNLAYGECYWRFHLAAAQRRPLARVKPQNEKLCGLCGARLTQPARHDYGACEDGNQS